MVKNENKLFLSGIGSQKKSFDRGDLEKDKFFIVHQKKINETQYTNTYSSFPSINEFLSFYDEQQESTKCYYELIRNHCCEYYDIDGKWSDGWLSIESFMDEFIHIRNEFRVDSRHNDRFVKPNEIIILESSNTVKMSLHILVRQDTYFKSCSDQKIWASDFSEWITLKYPSSKIKLDLSVYNNNSLMRIIDSHKGLDPSRKFKVYGNKIFNKKLLYCSYVPNFELLVPIEIRKKEIEVDEEVDTVPTLSTLSTLDMFKIFDNLAVVRWTVYESWRSLIWLALHFGLSEKEIRKLSSKAENYSEKSTDAVISSYSKDKCTLTFGTVCFYLKKDVDKKLYFELVGQYILARMNKKKVECLFDTSKYSSNTVVFPDEKWVTSKLLENENDKCIVIKAGLGKGKTTASVAHINTTKYDRIIVLTPRKSFAKSVLNRLNFETKLDFVLYSNLKGKNYIIEAPYIVIQVESLHRLDLEKFKAQKTLLLCDEIESILFQMTVRQTHGENHILNLDHLEFLFTHSTKIICLDAFISNKTLNTLSLMKIPFKFYNFTLPLEKRKCITFKEEEGFCNKLIKDLQEGKKIYFFCSSNKKLTEHFLPLIKKKFPNKKIIEYHSKFTSINLTTINSNWKDADVIACTSTMTVGCNFDLEGIFDKVYIYANGSSKNLVRDMFQSSYRVRHFNDKQMIYFVDKRHFGVNLPTDKKEILNKLKSKKKYVIHQYEHHLKMRFPTKDTPEWITELVLNNEYEQNTSIMMLDDVFNRYLTECSYEEEIDYDEEEFDFEEDEPVKLDDSFDYVDIPSITFDLAQELRKKKIENSITKLEEAQLEKFYFQYMLFGENRMKDQIELWEIYCDYGKGKFKNLSYEKGFNDGSVRICDIINDVYPEISNILSLRVEMIDKICKKIGIKHSQDFSQVSKEKIDECVDWFKTNSKKIHTVFDIRNQSKSNKFDSRTTTEIINKVFSKWGFSSIKAGTRSKKRVDGKIVYTTPYNIKNENDDEKKNRNIDVYKHIKPKVVKQSSQVTLGKNGELPMM